jgi:rhomboid family GlyGly-CTERM serine protease
MNLDAIRRSVCPFRSTLLIAALALVMNVGLMAGAPSDVNGFAKSLQYDRQAILGGQFWRLVTGSLMHWSPEHLALDLGAFLLLGLVYERTLCSSLSALCLGLSLAIGLAIFVFLPQLDIYRGLSGVDSGLFATALALESALARGQPRRWFWLLPAGAIFAIKIAYECVTGQLFFGTSALGELGLPVPLAHAAGALAGVAWIGCRPTEFAARSGIASEVV